MYFRNLKYGWEILDPQMSLITREWDWSRKPMSFRPMHWTKIFRNTLPFFLSSPACKKCCMLCILTILPIWDRADKLCPREMDCSCDSADLCPGALSFEAEGQWHKSNSQKPVHWCKKHKEIMSTNNMWDL
jgi:hypothetical protein